MTARDVLASAFSVLALLAATPAWAAIDSACQPVLDALDKLGRTPHRQHMTLSSTARPGNPITSEVVVIGDDTYIQIGGRWRKTTLTAAERKKQQQDALENAAMSCRHVRDEAVETVASTVYVAVTEKDGHKTQSTMWIATGTGLPVRQELDIDIGGALGKSHHAIRFDYTNVQAPSLK